MFLTKLSHKKKYFCLCFDEVLLTWVSWKVRTSLNGVMSDVKIARHKGNSANRFFKILEWLRQNKFKIYKHIRILNVCYKETIQSETVWLHIQQQNFIWERFVFQSEGHLSRVATIFALNKMKSFRSKRCTTYHLVIFIIMVCGRRKIRNMTLMHFKTNCVQHPLSFHL